ncbi:hypothetical protein MtrunA17_Chr7g0252611 [Medicago truncatula]|uniref:Uncharacterized protein n=1 Tax=Medicago truncatula TaxID=3880 RepID=A0A396H6Q5_MEDTR|nr:hypothetical protein MtrunA17_Chr7g0252611 [Medicago truncatula]
MILRLLRETLACDLFMFYPYQRGWFHLLRNYSKASLMSLVIDAIWSQYNLFQH